MTWHPVTQPPAEVGYYRLKERDGPEFMVRWDGRHFRYASGMFAGRAVVHSKSDRWKAPSNETKESEMLNEHDLQDMRPDEAVKDGWQPIETAPKDCEVWAFNGEQARMQWSEGHADNGEGWALWVWCDELLADADPEPEQPTHWMPLPAAPKEA